MKNDILEQMIATMSHLRGPEGCPWDRAQNATDLIPNLIEEAYELIDAIESGNTKDLREELGDLALQVFFHAQIASEKNLFDMRDVLTDLHEKLIRRHPHVFGEKKVKDAQQALKTWDEAKKNEKKATADPSALSGIPKSLPALQRAFKLGKKAAKVDFDWSHVGEVLKKFQEERQELDQAIATGMKEKIGEEMGDCLFALAQVARHLHIEPEEALRQANNKFEKRFRHMEKLAEKSCLKWHELDLNQLEALWQEAKKL